ncbi:hypothetical protein KY290_008118 [Solanum tuberosum]|uniref:Retrotransposon Copia-like N-terminal domain-containing protein n=1 Tax=Solanum tuberosum TaxID=4113 RepID=A0ABQ7W7I1_SOLTU|nr:hypothetical protein KY290_008118 [Solanum tuberosum]
MVDQITDSTTQVTGEAIAAVNNELPEKLCHNHPLFLHTIDNSGVLLSSIQLTGADNFFIWSRALKIAILGRNKLGFIDSSCKKEAYGPNLVNLWEHCNAIDLAERYDKVDGSRIFQLHKEIATVSQGTSSISAYFFRLRELWVEYDSLTLVPSCECVNSREFVKFMHNQKLLQFLMGLNDSYEQARGQILMMVPLPSLNKTYSLLIERESQRTISQTSSSANCSELSSMFTTGNNTSAMVPRPRPYTSSSYDPNAFCDYCKRTSHTQAICYQLHGYPPGFERRKRQNSTAHNVVNDGELDVNRGVNPRNQGYGRGSKNTKHVDYHKGMIVLHEQYNQILQMLGQSNMQGGSETAASTSRFGANIVQDNYSSAGNETALTVSPVHTGWIIDSGATNHMTPNSDILTHKHQLPSDKPRIVQLPNGETTQITHIGSCNVTPQDMLRNVLLVPDFKFNLLSVSQIIKDLKCAVFFFPNFVALQDLSNGKMKVIGREHAGLYLLPNNSSPINKIVHCLSH